MSTTPATFNLPIISTRRRASGHGLSVVCAFRHIHMSTEDALGYGVRDKSIVRVRVDPSFALAMHIDTDEANAANVQTGAQGFIEGIQNESVTECAKLNRAYPTNDLRSLPW